MTVSFKLVAGDTLSFETTAPTGDGVTYTASAGWTLKYRLVPRVSTGTPIALTATANGDDYLIAAAAADTASWESGWYSAAAWVEKGSERYTVEPAFAQVEILPNPATVGAGYDGRTVAQRMVDQLEAALDTYTASNGAIAEYQIGDRRMKFRAASEITNGDRTGILDYWRARRAKEVRADAIARGMADPRKGYIMVTPNG